MKEDIAVQEAVKLIGGSAVEVDMPEEETEPADLEETDEGYHFPSLCENRREIQKSRHGLCK